MLPGIDDGSKDVAMSLEMISRSVEQGVEGIIFTPHFYADMNSPETFLRKRDKALHELEDNLGSLPKVPVYTTGAEVHYFRGMSRSKDIERLCIGKSDYMLIEMPFRNWQPNMIDEIEEISLVLGLRVIIAHIERYKSLEGDIETVRDMVSRGVAVQINCRSFLDGAPANKEIEEDNQSSESHSHKKGLLGLFGKTEKESNRAGFFLERKGDWARALLAEGLVHFIASDCHDDQFRSPIYRTALEAMDGCCSEQILTDISKNNILKLIRNERIV